MADKIRRRFRILQAAIYVGKDLTYIACTTANLIFKTKFIKRLTIKLHPSVDTHMALGVVPADEILFDYPERKMSNIISTDPYFVGMHSIRTQFYGTKDAVVTKSSVEEQEA